MRLHEVEQGDGFARRLLIKFISMVSGMRLPDAARIVMYYPEFYGNLVTSWTQAAMRGASSWSVGERELMAAMTAKWNSCTFCIGAHSAIASLVFESEVVSATLENFRQAAIPDKLKTALTFLEIVVLLPNELKVADARTVLNNGVTSDELEDALAVATLFSITVRCADAFKFAIMSNEDLKAGAKRMLTQGYAFKKEKTAYHPDHNTFAERLRQQVLEGKGITTATLRQEMASRAAGGQFIAQPYEELAFNIGEAAWMVTDEQVAKVVAKTGSEKAAFELMISAAVGAGLFRWDKGVSVLKKALVN